MIDQVFVLFLVLITGAVLTSIVIWVKNNTMDRRLSRRSYIVPVTIIMAMLLILSQKIIWDLESLRLATARAIDKVLVDRWNQVEAFASIALEDNQALSAAIKQQVVTELSVYSPEELDVALDSIATTPGNIIQHAVGEAIKGKYFRGIVSDANDPFALLIGRGEDDSFLFADFSENCAVEDLTRNLHQEYELQGRAGDETLARVAFNSLINLQPGDLLSNMIFFRFEAGGGGAPLQSYTWKGLRQAFFENNGDIETTLQAYEILSPSYIFRDRSISGQARVTDRIRTDAKVIAIVSVFSLLEAIQRDPAAAYSFKQSEELQQYLQKEAIREERSMLLMGILIMIIAIILFMFFWTYLHYNLKEHYARTTQTTVRRERD